jgi:hypothetical protein
MISIKIWIDYECSTISTLKPWNLTPGSDYTNENLVYPEKYKIIIVDSHYCQKLSELTFIMLVHVSGVGKIDYKYFRGKKKS